MSYEVEETTLSVLNKKNIQYVHHRDTHVTKDGRIVGLDKWAFHKAIVIILPEIYKNLDEIKEQQQADEIKKRVNEGESNEERFSQLNKLKPIHPKEVMTQIGCYEETCEVYKRYTSKGIPLLTFDVSKGAIRKWVHFKCGAWNDDKYKDNYTLCIWNSKTKELVFPNVKGCGCGGKLTILAERIRLE